MSEIALRDQQLTIATLEHLIGTPAIPDRYETVPDALAAIFTGREMGLPPMTALSQLYIVDGQVALEGKTMLALIYRAGHKVHCTLTPTKATVVAYRWDEHAFPSDDHSGGYYEAGVFEFTMEDAVKAGLWENDNYQHYPTDMLGWKAVARAARFAYPDIIIGGYNPEDVTDEAPIDLFPTHEAIEIDRGPSEEEATGNVEEILDGMVEDGLLETVTEPDDGQ
jgi:hypothetical protein